MEGYTTININGRETGLLFGLYAIQRIFEKYGKISIDLNDTRESVKYYKNILYSAYLCDSEAMDIEPELTLRDFHAWVEKQLRSGDVSDLIAVILVYTKSIEVAPSKEKTGKETEKKNQ